MMSLAVRHQLSMEDFPWKKGANAHWQVQFASTCGISEDLNIPRHKLVMASQTRQNLQGVANRVVTICSSKEEGWDPWREAHGLSEVKIEHRFGQLRSQFAGGDMSARGFFSATARLMRKMGKARDKRSKDSCTDLN